ncbi:MAG: flagellar export chaperone FliS [Gammaproteobacteria bacterium]|nr:flagellar export chaperone FliS [Gammaproteobacteria bacterium]
MQRYHQVGVEAQVAGATPHELVQMLLDGAVARVVAAKVAMEAGEIARKGELIGRAIAMVEGLRSALDVERGGDLAANLEALYAYIERRLLEGNLRGDAAALDEVASLLREVQSGWRAIAETVIAAEGSHGTA